ncbi:DNA polymerase III subunit delta' [Rhodobacteraceae bacterium NNCM2]|nr:DNA polymerase III subunit delta' [Coraliihabitans acroporae]
MAEDDEEIIELDRTPGAMHPRETPRLYGQEQPERLFLDAWSHDRLHHAWLLRGPQGIGKATLAYRITRAIIADGPVEGGGLFGDAPTVPQTLDVPAGCPVASRIRAGAEPRLANLRLGVNAKTGRPRSQIVIEDVRGIKSFLQLSAADGGWRVVLVDPVDAMNRNAANALLKMLEEPPERTLMLLISHSPGGLLPTIRSRCRFLDLAPLSPDDLALALAQQETEVPPGAEVALSELAAGSVGRAMQLISGDGLQHYARIVSIIASGRVDRGAMIQLATALSGRGGAEMFPLISDLTQVMIGRLARAAATGVAPNPAAPAEADTIARIAAKPSQACTWAEAAARTAASLRHAMAVNLDPGQTIIDTFLDLDTTLGQARRLA